MFVNNLFSAFGMIPDNSIHFAYWEPDCLVARPSRLLISWVMAHGLLIIVRTSPVID